MERSLVFEPRVLSPGGSYARADDMRVGEEYFVLQFTVSEPMVPIMTTVTFCQRVVSIEEDESELPAVYLREVKAKKRGTGPEAFVNASDALYQTRLIGRTGSVAPLCRFEDALNILISREYVLRGKRQEKSDARPLSENPQPVVSDALSVGETYLIDYVDQPKLIPDMWTATLIGRNLRSGDMDRAYFQDVEAYRDGVSFETDEFEPRTIVALDRSDLDSIFDFEHAIEELMRCSLRRRGFLDLGGVDC